MSLWLNLKTSWRKPAKYNSFKLWHPRQLIHSPLLSHLPWVYPESFNTKFPRFYYNNHGFTNHLFTLFIKRSLNSSTPDFLDLTLSLSSQHTCRPIFLETMTHIHSSLQKRYHLYTTLNYHTYTNNKVNPHNNTHKH